MTIEVFQWNEAVSADALAQVHDRDGFMGALESRATRAIGYHLMKFAVRERRPMPESMGGGEIHSWSIGVETTRDEVQARLDEAKRERRKEREEIIARMRRAAEDCIYMNGDAHGYVALSAFVKKLEQITD
jgi:hypothetical protein